MRVRIAAAADTEVLAAVINSAFVVEKFFIDGDRVNLEMVRGFLDKGAFLIAEDDDGVAGCVYTEVRGDRGYLGLLSVDPARQKNGLGRLLVEAAEEHCRARGCTAMDLRVVNLREELPAFYRWLGYVENGTEEFPEGEVTKVPCHFVKMTRTLTGRPGGLPHED
jgi:GNAT superfamily N-acetyltransferase